MFYKDKPLLELPSQYSAKFLGAEATAAQLIRATVANHRQMFQQGDGQSQVHRANGLTWLHNPEDGGVTFAFPRLSRKSANETLDTALAECRHLGASQIACWSCEPTTPRDLGARLAARGFEWGWKPHWMALDLNHIQADFPIPPDLKITVHQEEADWDTDDLPYYARPKPGATIRHDPGRYWRFGAWQDGKIVGQSGLNLTTGTLGVAGIYHVGVVPTARNQGVGRAISLAACHYARALGCHWATLNAATHIYERLGFVSLGWGQTWFMHRPVLAAAPPTPAQVLFAEAVGRGDLQTLDSLAVQQKIPPDLNVLFPNGMSAMEMAIRPGKIASVDWLVKHGATLEIVHALELGWTDRIPVLLAANPALVNHQVGGGKTTPLHEAIMRDDPHLVRLLLTANPDLTLQDKHFRNTPLGWARHLERPEIIALLEAFDGVT